MDTFLMLVAATVVFFIINKMFTIYYFGFKAMLGLWFVCLIIAALIWGIFATIVELYYPWIIGGIAVLAVLVYWGKRGGQNTPTISESNTKAETKALCSKCGEQLDYASGHCKKCGALIEQSQPPDHPVEQPPQNTVQEEPTRFFCSKCGIQLDYTAGHCKSCGAPIAQHQQKEVVNQSAVDNNKNWFAKKSFLGKFQIIAAAIALVSILIFGKADGMFKYLFLNGSPDKSPTATSSQSATTNQAKPTQAQATVPTTPAQPITQQSTNNPNIRKYLTGVWRINYDQGAYFRIEVTQIAEGQFYANHHRVTTNGAKIDTGRDSILGSTRDGKNADVSWKSSFGGKGRAKVRMINDNEIEWTIDEATSSGDYWIPRKAILTRQ